jgi:hypothetical protein
MDYATTTSHTLKTAAILNKNDNIIPKKCSQKCNGVNQIN